MPPDTNDPATNSVTEEEVMAILDEKELAEGIKRADRWLEIGALVALFAAAISAIVWNVKP